TDPSPRPSPTTHIPNSIPTGSGGNHGGQSSSDRSLSGNEGGMTLQSVYDLYEECIHETNIGGKEILKDTVDAKGVYTENDQDVGKIRNVLYKEKESAEDAVSIEDVVSADKEKVSTDRSKESTDKEKDSTDKEQDSTDRPDEGTKGRSATPTTPTPTPTTFKDDETITQVLLNMSQAKAVLREKEKGVELKDVEKTERPRPTSTRSLLTLKPLPKIDPKDKGKKKIKEEDESNTESEIKEMNEGAKDLEQKRLKKKVAKETPKKEDTARKRKRPQSIDNEIEHGKCLKIVTFEGTMDREIMERKYVIARLNKVSSPDEDYLVIYRANGNFRAFHCLLEILHIFDVQDYSLINKIDWEIVTWRLYEACGVYILELKDGTVIHMLVEKRYPLSKDLLQRMLDLRLEVERERLS
ncbi:hypothetical protein Tco_0998081, partial [Tanacetum coccineum]